MELRWSHHFAANCAVVLESKKRVLCFGEKVKECVCLCAREKDQHNLKIGLTISYESD